MVAASSKHLSGVSWLVAQTSEAAARQLEPADKVRLLALFMVLIILGLTLMVVAWMGARAARRYMHSGRSDSSSTTTGTDDWAKKPLDSD